MLIPEVRCIDTNNLGTKSQGFRENLETTMEISALSHHEGKVCLIETDSDNFQMEFAFEDKVHHNHRRGDKNTPLTCIPIALGDKRIHCNRDVSKENFDKGIQVFEAKYNELHPEYQTSSIPSAPMEETQITADSEQNGLISGILSFIKVQPEPFKSALYVALLSAVVPLALLESILANQNEN